MKKQGALGAPCSLMIGPTEGIRACSALKRAEWVLKLISLAHHSKSFMTGPAIINGDRRQQGFTMIELILTLVIVGIMSAFVLPRFFGTHGFEERGFYDETITALRYAQKSAIASRRMVCVTFAEKTVTLKIAAANPAATTDCSSSSDLALAGPDGTTPYSVDATADTKYRNADIQFSPVPGTVTFDPLGRPNAAATIRVANFATAITVEAETGYVH